MSVSSIRSSTSSMVTCTAILSRLHTLLYVSSMMGHVPSPCTAILTLLHTLPHVNTSLTLACHTPLHSLSTSLFSSLIFVCHSFMKGLILSVLLLPIRTDYFRILSFTFSSSKSPSNFVISKSFYISHSSRHGGCISSLSIIPVILLLYVRN